MVLFKEMEQASMMNFPIQPFTASGMLEEVWEGVDWTLNTKPKL